MAWRILGVLFLVIHSDTAPTLRRKRKPTCPRWPGGIRRFRAEIIRTAVIRRSRKSRGATSTTSEPPGSVNWRREQLSATPVVKDGMMFLPVGSSIWALDARSGRVAWRYDTQTDAFSNRGVALGEVPCSRRQHQDVLSPLTQEKGDVKWTYTPPDRQVMSAPPPYGEGLVFAGVSEGDNFKRGRIVAVSAKTGKEVWRFDAIPGPANRQCDLAAGQRHLEIRRRRHMDGAGGGRGTGAPVRWNRQRRATMGRRAAPRRQSIHHICVALELKTGRMKWHYQPCITIFGSRPSTPLVLYDAGSMAVSVKVLVAMRTDGISFFLDRETGTPDSPDRRTSGEAGPVSENVGHTAVHERCPDRLGPGLRGQGPGPSGIRRRLLLRSAAGRHAERVMPHMNMRQSPMAYSPQAGYLYATACVNPAWIRRDETGWAFITPTKPPGMKQYGLMAALDGRTGKVVWENGSHTRRAKVVEAQRPLRAGWCSMWSQTGYSRRGMPERAPSSGNSRLETSGFLAGRGLAAGPRSSTSREGNSSSRSR